MTNRCGYPKGCARLRDGAGGSPAAATGPMQELVAWARGVVGRQLKVPQGRTLGRASESPGMDTLARSWRSSPWWQQLQGSLEHAPAASACSAECCALPAARRSRPSTSSTSPFNASTGTTSAWRRPPSLLGRRLDATTGRLGPVAARAVRLVPSAASVRTWKVGGLLFLLLC